MNPVPREFTTAADIIANARAVRQRLKFAPHVGARPSPPQPAPEPVVIVAVPPPLPQPIEPQEPQLDEPNPAIPISKPLAVRRIIRMVARYYGISEDDIRGGSRLSIYVVPRHIVMYLCMRRLGLSSPHTGRLLGGFDHSTVVLAARRLPNKIAINPTIATAIVEFCNQIEEWK